MLYDFVTLDVFTDTLFGGNPLAVLPDARGLTTKQMQAIAREFNYSETTFVLPPEDENNTRKVRIFTPMAEIPFAGHPNVGTAVALARLGLLGEVVASQRILFEELAGVVSLFLHGATDEINAAEAKTLVDNGCFCVSEGANMPTEPAGIDVFLKAKILYGPGKAANAGGVAVSGLEMSQNSMRIGWTREEVDQRLQTIMKDIHSACVKYGKDGDFINYVNGANVAGFIKIADAMLDQGVV